MRTADVVIIGAGLSGAATAYRLTRMGVRHVLLLEREEVPGMHSSGRNAAIIRVVVGDPPIAELAREGGAFLRDPQPGWDEPPAYHRCGSLLTGARAALEPIAADTPPEVLEHLRVAWWSPAACAARHPVLRGVPLEAALWCPLDGVVDVAALLQGYLHEAHKGGARLETRCEVRGILVEGGAVRGVDTSLGVVRTERVVNAAGPWARAIGRLAGGVDVPIVPYRRHLFSTGPLEWVDPQWPIVWDPTRQVYFRPESGGLLLSPCDETPAEPGIPPVDPAAAEDLADKLARFFPALSEVPIRNAWAGLRSFAPDHRFVIGWDPRVRGFLWMAGLGGHGVTASSSSGLLAARLLLGEAPDPRSPFSPERFAS